MFGNTRQIAETVAPLVLVAGTGTGPCCRAGPTWDCLPVIDSVEPVTAVAIGATIFDEQLAASPAHLAVQLAAGTVAVAGITVLSRSSVVKTGPSSPRPGRGRIRPAPERPMSLYEPPFSIDDNDLALPAGFAGELAGLVSAGRRGDAVEWYQAKTAGILWEVVTQMRHAPFRPGLEAIVHTSPATPLLPVTVPRRPG